MTAPIRLVLAEDHGLVRDSLVEVLTRQGFEVLAAVGDAEALLAAADQHRPELVLTDVRMPPTFGDAGLRAAVQLRRHRVDLAVVVLSQYVEPEYATALLTDDGAGVGYLLKDRVADTRALAAVLRRVAAGETVIDPEVTRHLLRAHRDPLARLTGRERETLALMAEGRANAFIGEAMCVSESSVAKNIRSIFDKLDLPPTEDGHRRVLAVLTWLNQR